MAREEGECKRRYPLAAACPRAPSSAPPGAARHAAAPQLQAPGHRLR